jgi:adenylate kinase family enzyme
MARIHITGASGAGVSTLGRALAEVIDVPWHDTDDYFWLPTDPPYVQTRPIPDRLALLTPVLDASLGWVLAGSVGDWGDPLIPRFDLVVFLQTPMALRIARLRQRERAAFGAAIDPGGVMHDAHEAFIAWAAAYDLGTQPGRNLGRHLAWLEALPCPVLRLDGSAAVPALVDEALRVVRQLR